MSENLYKKIEELYLSGRITEEEKNALLKALEDKEKNVEQISQININIRATDLEIVGKEDIHYPQFGQGSLKMVKNGNTLYLEDSLVSKDFAKILVPYKSNILIKSVSSNISVSSILGFLQIQSVSSDVLIQNVSDRVIVSLISGDVEITNAYGRLDITTKSGDIRINESKIEGILKTYSGDIIASIVEFKNSRFNTFNGDITLRKSRFLNKCAINTYFGDVSVGVAGDVLINAFSSMGSVSSNYRLNSRNVDNELKVETKFGDIDIEDESYKKA
ncbi:DUF4097 family beta strand repeat-containing protein [Caldisericum exile]|uniref:DUF4097 domain-containing protein n=1 Tax=Caldisericum exile (strain DSM 21853 / NBRC 104410 / AZM16c01) TaxID=511051 RepID=A0A7U6GEB4_CALEA|nr:DUF4097 family beta strand repeat-containing protein [Caldisericum exile]BAL80822.1 hypothetical protein CSE_06960 [Caldisericum exile AZM16c01]